MRCLHCGAPLELSPDSVVVVCRYCGFANFVAGDPADVLAVGTLPAGEILKRAVERTRRDFHLGRRMSRINFAAPQLFYVPFYFVDVDLWAAYRAKVSVTYTRTVYVGGRPTTRLESRVVEVAGRVHYGDVVGVLARRAAWGLSVDRLVRHFFKTAPTPSRLEDVVSGAEVAKSFMSGELTPEQAKAKAVRSAVAELLRLVDQDARNRAAARVGGVVTSAAVLDKAVDYDVKRLEASKLTYLPMWAVPYFFENSAYRYYVAGWDGEVLVAEEPSFVEHKLASAVGAAVAGGSVGGLGLSAFLPDLVLSSTAVALGGVLSYMAAGGLLKSRRVEKR